MSGFKLFGANGDEVTCGVFDTISSDIIDYFALKELILDELDRVIGVISSGNGHNKARHFDF